jgi:hypothetical protein
MKRERNKEDHVQEKIEMEEAEQERRTKVFKKFRECSFLENPTESEIQEAVDWIRNRTCHFEELGLTFRSNDAVIEAALEMQPNCYVMLGYSERRNAKYILMAVKGGYKGINITESILEDDIDFINQLALISGESLIHVNHSLITYEVLYRVVVGNRDIGRFILARCSIYTDLVKLLLENEHYRIIDYIVDLRKEKAYELLESVSTISKKVMAWTYIIKHVYKICRDRDLIIEFLKYSGKYFEHLTESQVHYKEYQLLAAKKTGERNIHLLIFKKCCYNPLTRYDSWYEYIRTVSDRIGVKRCNEFVDVIFKFNQ